MTTPVSPGDDDEVELRNVSLRLCVLCLGGAGGECHVPGCALWINRAPDLAIDPLLYEVVDETREAKIQALRDAFTPVSAEVHEGAGHDAAYERLEAAIVALVGPTDTPSTTTERGR